MSKIAWIEDDYPEISSLVRLLELDKHDILRYRTWRDVEEHLDEICQCDAVILDIILPPATENRYLGVSVLKKLREECKYNGPVVVCTIVKNPGVLNNIYNLGVSDTLHKPVRPSSLYDAVTKALKGATSNEGE